MLNELVEETAKSHAVCVLTGLPNYPKGDFFPGYSSSRGPYRESYKGASVLRYPILPRKKGFPRLILNYLSHLLGASLAQFWLPKADWAFVFGTSPITTTIPAILWARLNGSRVCLWLQDLWPESVVAVGAAQQRSWMYKILALIVRWIYRRVDLVLIQSPAFSENLKEFGYSGPIHFVPNWAPEMDFQNAKEPEWLRDLPRDKMTVTFAGNVGRAQGIDTLMVAAEKLSHESRLQFVIVGDGSDLQRVQALAREKRLSNVHFFGRKPLSDMAGLFQRSDALLVMLKKDPIFAKTIPSKVQAYLASGRPLIGSLDGSGAQVIEESQCGFVGPSEDAEALVQNLVKLLSQSPSGREQMGANGSRYFQLNFHKQKVVSEILRLLQTNP
ncbi:MAG: glycosyltransferase family 4 protein [Bdellovibrionales bacterium]